VVRKDPWGLTNPKGLPIANQTDAIFLHHDLSSASSTATILRFPRYCVDRQTQPAAFVSFILAKHPLCLSKKTRGRRS
jgi:hypothetical protein